MRNRKKEDLWCLLYKAHLEENTILSEDKKSKSKNNTWTLLMDHYSIFLLFFIKLLRSTSTNTRIKGNKIKQFVNKSTFL
ncbi:hypothetical protein C8J95_104106 [Elizabethkingia sp. YR214]|nr:hypothetical protein C8J95_104106 [Elizabethkingia sp. YR214]